jgi:ribose transport system ATP-binding protein
MENISKKFPGVQALKNVDFTVHAGEVVILVGENGAGKSTLMKIIAGVYQNDTGDIYFEDEKVVFDNPAEAKERGISIVYQEQALVPDLTAIENIFIGEEETIFLHRSMFGFLNKKTMRKKAEKMIRDTFGMTIDLTCPVSELPLVERQIIEIIRAIIHDAKLLILDEPTAALEDSERAHLFDFINKLKKIGVGIIYCSHYIEECIEIGDRIVAVRDGEKAGECPKKDTSVSDVIEMMIGKQLTEQYPKSDSEIGREPIMTVRNLSLNKEYKDISFQLFPGEILGFGGLAGSGKSELARTLFGIKRSDVGTIIVDGEFTKKKYNPLFAMNSRIAFLPADRKTEGLFLDQPLTYNVSIVNLNKIADPWLKKKLEKELTTTYIEKINIKTPSPETTVRQLSGGNQQKVMIARWFCHEPKILIFEEPTRGIDVNAKVEVYKLIGEFVSQGGAVIIISTEVQELEGVCDRVLVMHNGTISAELKGDDISKEKITYHSVTSN